jgi:hypothetical protein
MKLASHHIPLCALLALLFLEGFVRAFWSFHNVEPSARFYLLSGLTLIWSVSWWVAAESKGTTGARPVYCGSMLMLLIAWPLVVGWHALKMRGAGCVPVVLIMIGIYLSGMFAAVLVLAAQS